MDTPTLSKELFPYLSDSARIMLVGPTDVGKTTFVRDYARYLVSKGLRPWVVDLDVGQSDVGPVGTVAAAQASGEFTLLEELEPSLIEFFGYVAPSFDMGWYVSVLHRLAFRLKDEAPLIIDTTGWVAGYEAFSLKLMKARLFAVDTVILVGKGFENWRVPFEALGVRVFVVEPSSLVVPKDKSKRRINRYAATEAYFRDKPAVKMDLSQYPVWCRFVKDVKFCLLGGLSRGLGTVSVGWVISQEGTELVVKLSVLKKVKPAIIKIGQKVSL